jgi:hypothetical protein
VVAEVVDAEKACYAAEDYHEKVVKFVQQAALMVRGR